VFADPLMLGRRVREQRQHQRGRSPVRRRPDLAHDVADDRLARPSFASAWSRSTIWSSRALKKSLCPLSRRSFGRIESPSAKPTERQNHDQTPRSICKKSS
jgi:hypothetical protein